MVSVCILQFGSKALKKRGSEEKNHGLTGGLLHHCSWWHTAAESHSFCVWTFGDPNYGGKSWTICIGDCNGGPSAAAVPGSLSSVSRQKLWTHCHLWTNWIMETQWVTRQKASAWSHGTVSCVWFPSKRLSKVLHPAPPPSAPVALWWFIADNYGVARLGGFI